MINPHVQHILGEMGGTLPIAKPWPNTAMPVGHIVCVPTSNACVNPGCPSYPEEHPPSVICHPNDVALVERWIAEARTLWTATTN